MLVISLEKSRIFSAEASLLSSEFDLDVRWLNGRIDVEYFSLPPNAHIRNLHTKANYGSPGHISSAISLTSFSFFTISSYPSIFPSS